MNLFVTLTNQNKKLIIFGSAMLIVLAVALLIFGHNVKSGENKLIKQASEATRADMLYVHPEETPE